MGLQIQVLNASSGNEIIAAFAALARERFDALLVGTGSPFTTRRFQLIQLATYYRIPALYAQRLYAEIGG